MINDGNNVYHQDLLKKERDGHGTPELSLKTIMSKQRRRFGHNSPFKIKTA